MHGKVLHLSVSKPTGTTAAVPHTPDLRKSSNHTHVYELQTQRSAMLISVRWENTTQALASTEIFIAALLGPAFICAACPPPSLFLNS